MTSKSEMRRIEIMSKGTDKRITCSDCDFWKVDGTCIGFTNDIHKTGIMIATDDKMCRIGKAYLGLQNKLDRLNIDRTEITDLSHIRVADIKGDTF